MNHIDGMVLRGCKPHCKSSHFVNDRWKVVVSYLDGLHECTLVQWEHGGSVSNEKVAKRISCHIADSCEVSGGGVNRQAR